jgi:hypothetical protein
VLLTTGWQKDFGLPPTLIKGGVAGSGMFDLKPVRIRTQSSSYVSVMFVASISCSKRRKI